MSGYSGEAVCAHQAKNAYVCIVHAVYSMVRFCAVTLPPGVPPICACGCDNGPQLMGETHLV